MQLILCVSNFNEYENYMLSAEPPLLAGWIEGETWYDVRFNWRSSLT